jgi:hypothetical protein
VVVDSSPYAEIEIGLHRWTTESYSVELRSTPPEADGEVVVRVVHGVRFDQAGLRARAADPVAYGQLLTDCLFADKTILAEFARACDQDVELRFRLFVGPNVPELHRLRWETLRDPRQPKGSWLVTNERILFSRYLSGSAYLNHRNVALRQRAAWHALVVIADPSGGKDYKLAPIDAKAELERARDALTGIEVEELKRGERATLQALIDHLGNGPNILYLVCHGERINGQSFLYLEDDQGEAARTPTEDVAERLRDLATLPRLVVLASCQSAGKADASDEVPGAFERAIGPLLADVGVPAVVAMQGDVSMETSGAFFKRFFTELSDNEPIDRAVAVARGVVRDRPDSWMPVLFMRLRSGGLWYSPGFHKKDAYELWPALISAIRSGDCTPILGPGIHETLLGSPREIALRWSEEFGFPLAPEDRDQLPRVAQFLAVNMKAQLPRSAFRQYLRDQMLSRYRELMPPEIQEVADLPPDQRDPEDPKLLDLVAIVGKHRRASDEADPHKILAQLPVPIYVTTSPGNLLYEALVAEKKEPRTELSRWNDATIRAPSPFKTDPSYEPDVKHPLVYHPFGHFDDLRSLVLTEDDYFDFLIGLTRNEDLIPPAVAAALANTSLLFLGFQMEDWVFRVLFRTIVKQEGSSARGDFPHVAVQVDPEDDRIVSPERAARYFEKYLQGASVDVYWGKIEDFVGELRQKMRPAAGSRR